MNVNKFIYVEQTKDQLPLLATDFYYVNPLAMLHTSTHRKELISNLDNTLKLDLLYGIHFLGPAYPRFHREDYFYKVSRSPIYHFLPDLQNIRKLNFFDITDLRAMELESLSEKFKNVYLFWSGGIDSTVILSAILKNWKQQSLEKLIVVLNSFSIEENQSMYEKHIHNKLSTVSTDKFFSGEINFSHDNLYVDGNAADTLSATIMFYEFDKRFPNYYSKPWKQHVNVLIKFFSEYEDLNYGQYMYKKVVKSLIKNNFEVETIFDFLWWMGFNWIHDRNLHCILWQYTPCFFADPSISVQRFLEENMFQWFNSNDYQDWRVSAVGTNEIIGNSISEHKLAFKKYIFDFNKDDNYFYYKDKVASTPKNKTKSSHIILCGIDTDYNYYYRHAHEKIWPPK